MPMPLRRFVLALGLTAIASTALAAASSGIGGSGPLSIDTDTGTSEVNTKTCHFTIDSGVHVTQGSVRLTARKIEVTGQPRAGSCDVNHFDATDQVFYVTPERTVKADHGVYDAQTGTAVFTGSGAQGVVVLEGRNVTTTPKLTVNTASGAAKAEGGFRAILFPETSYRAAGAGWTLSTSAVAVSLTRSGGAPIDVGNPGLVETGDVLSWTTPQLKVTLTKGACSFGGQSYDYVAQVQAGSSSYSGCGGAKSTGS